MLRAAARSCTAAHLPIAARLYTAARLCTAARSCTAAVLLGAGLLHVACDAKDSAKTRDSSPDKTATAGAPVRPPEPPIPPAEFQVGSWSGVAMPKLAALIENDKTQKEHEMTGAVGLPPEPLSFVLAIDPAGNVTGEAQMGAHQAQLSGAYEESQIRASFSGLRMTGTLLAARQDGEFRGEVRLSLLNRSESAEQLVPWVAELALKKQK